MVMPVSPLAVAAALTELWSPRVVAELDDSYVKVAKVQGTLAWHAHDNEDELFFILKGKLRIEMEDGAVELSEGEAFVVPKGRAAQPGRGTGMPPHADRAQDDAAHGKRSDFAHAQPRRAAAAGVKVHHLAPADAALFAGMLDVFAQAFDDAATYRGARPGAAYMQSLLADPNFIALVAVDGATPVGALAAYVLRKFEQERSEIYIYDLAVDAHHRRKGIATALIRTLGEAARERGAWTMFVQADIGEEDEAANALYRKLAFEMIVANHYDIAP